MSGERRGRSGSFDTRLQPVSNLVSRENEAAAFIDNILNFLRLHLMSFVYELQ